jgi:hypothetical protein
VHERHTSSLCTAKQCQPASRGDRLGTTCTGSASQTAQSAHHRSGAQSGGVQ